MWNKLKKNDWKKISLYISIITLLFYIIVLFCNIFFDNAISFYINIKYIFAISVISLIFYFSQIIKNILENKNEKSKLTLIFSYLFLLTLFVIVINQFFKNEIIINYLFEFFCFFVMFGFFTFFLWFKNLNSTNKTKKNIIKFLSSLFLINLLILLLKAVTSFRISITIISSMLFSVNSWRIEYPLIYVPNMTLQSFISELTCYSQNFLIKLLLNNGITESNFLSLFNT